MKIHTLRYLVLPWFIFFGATVFGIVSSSIEMQMLASSHKLFGVFLGSGILLCLIANYFTLSKAGIWLAYSLPSSLKYNSWPWLLRALKAGVTAGIFFLVGLLPWMPLIWQAFVIPFVFTITLFVGVWSLMGPVLSWSSKKLAGRALAFISSLPVFALIPLTAIFLGNNITRSYFASQPDVLFRKPTAEKVAIQNEAPELPAPTEKRALLFKEYAEGTKPCPEGGKDIQAALSPSGSEETVFWAIKAMKCADMKNSAASWKLAKLITDHPSNKVKVLAIQVSPRLGHENLKSLGWILVKKINEKESFEVIEASASLLSKIGEDERKMAVNRLKSLLDNKQAHASAAKVLVNTLKKSDVVEEYINKNLVGSAEGRQRAVSMICQLPKNQRSINPANVEHVVAAIQSGSKEDPATQALECLGQSGFQAIRREVLEPKNLSAPVAARALAEMDIENSPEALETAEACVHSGNDEVRKWCGQSLGKVGASALPKIMDLLKSGDRGLKEAGRTALHNLDDPKAKSELEQIRAENTGWMANKSKLQIAEAVGTALVKIKTIEASETN